MKQQTCKIIFTVFALLMLFLSCNQIQFKGMDSTEHFENVSQNESYFKSGSERIFVFILPNKPLFGLTVYEEKSCSSIEKTELIRMISKMIPVGILAPPSRLF